MPGLDWLTARPIAHRGLHDAASGVIENTSSAFAAAIAGNYAIECDLQMSADGEAIVFHDGTLDRLTERRGEVSALTVADLKQVPFKATRDRMMSLGDLCDLVSGRVTLVLEMKSAPGRNGGLPAQVADVLKSYTGPVAAMSFDPSQIVALGQRAPGLPRGVVAEWSYDGPGWSDLTGGQKTALAYLLHAGRTRPHFVAYSIKDLPAFAPLLGRYLFGAPLLTWTVRTDADRRRAARFANQMIFEGFRP